MLSEHAKVLAGHVPFLCWVVFKPAESDHLKAEGSPESREGSGDGSIALLGDRAECVYMKFIP